MQYGLRDLGALLRTPAGRFRVRRAAVRQLWPLLARVAAFHRRTFARRCKVVAVVGSNGKTTTARAVGAALGTRPASRVGANCWTAIAAGLALMCQPWELGAFRWGFLCLLAGTVLFIVTSRME